MSFDREEFARSYTAAWCSQDPDRVAAHFSAQGSLRVNSGPAAAGRDAITEVVRGFMEAFPDLEVRFDRLSEEDGRPVYHWTLLGTSNGRRVVISGQEKWTLDENGCILASQGSFDEADYRRQLEGGA
jgi:nuclear transport factor 2 (NTF2) superfamily protein